MNFARVLSMPDSTARTAALAAWVQSRFEAGREPVLVGGAAVEIYTGGAYTTGDLDMVGVVSRSAAAALAAAGFSRTGRHWIHEEGRVFLEFPASTLLEGERSIRVRKGRVEVLLVSPEDLIAERLAAWQDWRSVVDGANAWRLYRALGAGLDRARARRRCVSRGAEKGWRRLLAFARRAANAPPSEEEVFSWAHRIP